MMMKVQNSILLHIGYRWVISILRIFYYMQRFKIKLQMFYLLKCCIPLQLMKRKFAIFNLVLMTIVQFTIGYQSFHAFSHKHYAENHTASVLKKKFKHTVTANNHENEDCSVCDFHFDFFVAPAQFCLKLDFPFKSIPYTVAGKESNAFFAGSLFALRAPPSLV